MDFRLKSLKWSSVTHKMTHIRQKLQNWNSTMGCAKAYQMPKHCIAVHNTTGSEFTTLEGYHAGNHSNVHEIKSSITLLKLALTCNWLANTVFCKMMLHSLREEVDPGSTFMLELCAYCTNTQLFKWLHIRAALMLVWTWPYPFPKQPCFFVVIFYPFSRLLPITSHPSSCPWYSSLCHLFF